MEHPYNKRFVAFINQGIKPISKRKFNGATKRWEVHVIYIHLVVAAGKRFFEHVDYSTLPADDQIRVVQYLKGNGAPPPRSKLAARPEVAPHAVLFVTTDAPPEVIKAAYRALAQKHHPDHGGDEEEFKRIDAAYKRLTSAQA